FQLVDDALDYGGTAAKLGKNVGDDFREGKITLPVVLAFRRGSDSERTFWRRTLEEGEAADADLEQAISLMIKHRALEDTVKRARAGIQAACEARQEAWRLRARARSPAARDRCGRGQSRRADRPSALARSQARPASPAARQAPRTRPLWRPPRRD